jgi:hypothetical protein
MVALIGSLKQRSILMKKKVSGLRFLAEAFIWVPNLMLTQLKGVVSPAPIKLLWDFVHQEWLVLSGGILILKGNKFFKGLCGLAPELDQSWSWQAAASPEACSSAREEHAGATESRGSAHSKFENTR